MSEYNKSTYNKYRKGVPHGKTFLRLLCIGFCEIYEG